MSFEMQPLFLNPVCLRRLTWQEQEKEPLLLPSGPVLLALPTAMEGSPILNHHGDWARHLPVLLGFLCLPVHQGQVALGLDASHHEAIVKANLGFPKA